MATKHFYLVGSDPSTAREIDLSPAQDWIALQKYIALQYNIVEPTGMHIHHIPRVNDLLTSHPRRWVADR